MDTPLMRCSDSARFVSGKLADVLGDDAVDDALRIALQVHRGGETAADARDDDLLERFRGLRERRQCDGGPENQRNGLCDGRTSACAIDHGYAPCLRRFRFLCRKM